MPQLQSDFADKEQEDIDVAEATHHHSQNDTVVSPMKRKNTRSKENNPKEENDTNGECLNSELKEAQRDQKEEEKKLEDQKGIQMTEKQKRLFNLRLRLNEARKRNLEEAAQEKQSKKQKEQKKVYKNRKRIREELKSIDITAEQAEYIEKKKQQKLKNSISWDPHSVDIHYKAYNSRVKNIQGLMSATEKLVQEKHITDEEDLEEIAKERLANELKERIEKSKSFMRRRQFNEDADVDYINSTNQNFNKKISKAYDKYTSEIKQNLERGTAV